MANKNYNFGEKPAEYSPKHGREIPVWQSPKYIQAKKKVIEMLESDQYKEVLDPSDFWILMNATKNDKMAYTGLIISHNGCLKINDTLPQEKKFRPACLVIDKEGYNNSLVFIYACDDQGIFEVGEVSNANLKNVYPYAMALKRCFDRVVLKVSRLAYAGVYSDSEAEEFKRPDEDPALQQADKQFKVYSDQPQPVEGVNYMKEFMDICNKYGLNKNSYAQAYKLNSKSTNADFFNACQTLKKEIEG